MQADRGIHGRATLWLPNLCACCGATSAPHLYATSGSPYAGTVLDLTFPYCGDCRGHARWAAFKQSARANVLVKASIVVGLLAGGAAGIASIDALGIASRPLALALAVVAAIAGMLSPWVVARLGDRVFGHRGPKCSRGACVSHVRLAVPNTTSGVRVRFEFANAAFEHAFRAMNSGHATAEPANSRVGPIRRARCQFINPEEIAAA